MTDIVFIFPSARGNRAVFNSHLGVAYLQAVLKRHEIKSMQYLRKNPGTIWEVAREILDPSPRIAGFTVYDSNFGVCCAIADCLKTLKPDLVIICGGPTATFSDREILTRSPSFDVCIRGEAEGAGVEIIEELIGAPSGQIPDILDQIEGASYFRENEFYTTGIARNSPGSRHVTACPLDLLPSPYLDGILMDGRTGILTGRGCNQNCAYCQFAALGKKKIRLHSIDRVLAELELISNMDRKKGMSTRVTIHDDTFSLLPERAGELCQAIADRQLGLQLTCITRADRVDGELLGLMKQAGFTSIAFGLESAVPRVLHVIGKVRKPLKRTGNFQREKDFIESVRVSVHKARELGITAGVSIILGLPTETIEEARKTVDFVRSLPVDYYMHNILQVFPGTPLWENHEEYSIGTVKGPVGLPVTVSYSFDPYKVKPADKSISNYESYFVRLLAGASAFGCGSALPPHEELDTVVIRSNNLSGKLLDWLRNNLRIGGIVIQFYDGKVKPGDEIIEGDRTGILSALVPSRFHIQLMPEYAGTGKCIWNINSEMAELAGAYSPGLTRLRLEQSVDPLLEWIKNRKRTSELCDLGFSGVDRLHELAIIMDDIKQSAILTTWPFPPFLVYPGRFSHNKPPCRTLSRIEIDADGNIRVCAHGEVLGNIHENFDFIRNRFGSHLKKSPDYSCPFPSNNGKIRDPESRKDGCLSLIDFYSRTDLLYKHMIEVSGS